MQNAGGPKSPGKKNSINSPSIRHMSKESPKPKSNKLTPRKGQFGSSERKRAIASRVAPNYSSGEKQDILIEAEKARPNETLAIDARTDKGEVLENQNYGSAINRQVRVTDFMDVRPLGDSEVNYRERRETQDSEAGNKEFKLAESELNEEIVDDDLAIDQGEMTLGKSPIRVQTTTVNKAASPKRHQHHGAREEMGNHGAAPHETSMTELSINVIGTAAYAKDE